MERKKLTATEAWKDFSLNIVPAIEGEIPNELHQARRAFEGKLKRLGKKGKERVITLGPERIRRLLDKYAPGRYEYHNDEPYFTKVDEVV